MMRSSSPFAGQQLAPAGQARAGATRFTLTLARFRRVIYCMPVPPIADAIPRSLLRDNAFHSIRRAIVDGTLAPGERLNDADLARGRGGARPPVRGGLARLGEAGLVQPKPGRYTMVSPLD